MGYYPTNRAPSFSRPLSVVTITPSRPHIRKRALHAIRSLVECDSAMLRELSPEVSRHLRDKDQAVIGSALIVCISLHKVGSCRNVSWGHFLTFLEWVTGPRYSRQCVPSTTPVWKDLHRFSSSSAGSAEGTTVVLYCSVSCCSLIWGTFNDVLEQTFNGSAKGYS